jgi:hypothetical protein
VSEVDISVIFLQFVTVDKTLFAKHEYFTSILFLEVHHVLKIRIIMLAHRRAVFKAWCL